MYIVCVSVWGVHIRACVTMLRSNFHECVNLDQFEGARTLSLVPPDGEFVVMNYRITSDFRAPFRLFPFVEETSPHKVEMLLKIRADIPDTNYGAGVVIRFPVPRNASTVHPEIDTSTPAAGGAGGSAGAGAKGKLGQVRGRCCVRECVCLQLHVALTSTLLLHRRVPRLLSIDQRTARSFGRSRSSREAQSTH